MYTLSFYNKKINIIYIVTILDSLSFTRAHYTRWTWIIVFQGNKSLVKFTYFAFNKVYVLSSIPERTRLNV